MSSTFMTGKEVRVRFDKLSEAGDFAIGLSAGDEVSGIGIVEDTDAQFVVFVGVPELWVMRYGFEDDGDDISKIFNGLCYVVFGETNFR